VVADALAARFADLVPLPGQLPLLRARRVPDVRGTKLPGASKFVSRWFAEDGADAWVKQLKLERSVRTGVLDRSSLPRGLVRRLKRPLRALARLKKWATVGTDLAGADSTALPWASLASDFKQVWSRVAAALAIGKFRDPDLARKRFIKQFSGSLGFLSLTYAYLV
jgi:hypothetical protein